MPSRESASASFKFDHLCPSILVVFDVVTILKQFLQFLDVGTDHEVHCCHLSTGFFEEDESRNRMDVEFYRQFLGLIGVDPCDGHLILFFVGFDERLDQFAGRGPAE